MSEEQEGSPAGIKGSVGVRGVRLRAKRAIAGGHNALTMASARAVFLTEDAVDPESWVKVTQDSGTDDVWRILVLTSDDRNLGDVKQSRVAACHPPRARAHHQLCQAEARSTKAPEG